MIYTNAHDIVRNKEIDQLKNPLIYIPYDKLCSRIR